MPRKNQLPLTEEERFIFQEQREQELGKLNRNYNILEKDRRLYAGGEGFNRLANVLKIYKKEHNNILIDLEVASAPANKRNDAKAFDNLAQLLGDHTNNLNSLKISKQQLHEVHERILEVEREVLKLRRMQITDRQHEERTWAAMKTVEGLMNKWEIQNKKFGVVCAKNRKMKLEIEGKLWERRVFMKSWNKLIHKLVLGKKFMMDLIEQATIAYDQREEWCSKLQALRYKAHHDFIMHVQEMREMERKQDNNDKLEKFFNTKGMKRMMWDLEAKRKAKQLELRNELEERLCLYNQYTQEILEFTNEKEVSVIAQNYHQREQLNFSLFMHVNNLIQELEVLGEQLQHYQNEIEDERVLEIKRWAHRDQVLRSLQNDKDQAIAELERTKNEFTEIDDYINGMISGIDTLFKICRCDKDPILQLLDDNRDIHIFNVFFHVEMVESAVLKALAEVYQDEKLLTEKKSIKPSQKVIYECFKPAAFLSTEQMTPSNPCPLCLSREMVSDVIDKVQYPMSRSQIQKTLEERSQKTDFDQYLHTVSECFLPESREVVQRRYV